MTFTIEYGSLVEDKITGFAGEIIGRADYITGCNQYLIQPKLDENGKYIDCRWIDEDRLYVTKVMTPSVTRNVDKPPGADKPAPKK